MASKATAVSEFKISNTVDGSVARWRIECPERGAFEFALDLAQLDIDSEALAENTRQNLPTRIACKGPGQQAGRDAPDTYWEIKVAHVRGLVTTFKGTSIALVAIPSAGPPLSEWRTAGTAVGQALTADICRLSGAAEN